MFVAAGDVTGEGRAAIITGTYQFGGPVRVFTLQPDGVAGRADFFAYFSQFLGPVHVGTADINGDGVSEIITGAGPYGGPHVRVLGLAGGTLAEFASFYAYDPGFCDFGVLVPGPEVCDGVYVAGADIDGDGVAEVITATNRQGGPLRVLRIGAGITELTSFYPYFAAFPGPVYVATVIPSQGSLHLDALRASRLSMVAMSSMDHPSRQTAGLVRILFDGDPVDGRARSPPARFRTVGGAGQMKASALFGAGWEKACARFKALARARARSPAQ